MPHKTAQTDQLNNNISILICSISAVNGYFGARDYKYNRKNRFVQYPMDWWKCSEWNLWNKDRKWKNRN